MAAIQLSPSFPTLLHGKLGYGILDPLPLYLLHIPVGLLFRYLGKLGDSTPGNILLATQLV